MSHHSEVESGVSRVRIFTWRQGVVSFVVLRGIEVAMRITVILLVSRMPSTARTALDPIHNRQHQSCLRGLSTLRSSSSWPLAILCD